MADRNRYNRVEEMGMTNLALENQYAMNLRMDRLADEQEQEEYEESEDAELRGELGEIARSVSHGSKLAMIKQGIQLGLTLRQQSSDLRFDGLGFLVVLGMCAIKDLIDIASLSVSGWITTPLLVFPLTIFFFMRSSFVKRWLIEKFLWRFFLAAIFETMPATSMFPTFTISCILLRMSIDKKRRKLEEKAKALEA